MKNPTTTGRRAWMALAVVTCATLTGGCRGPWRMRDDPRSEPMDAVVVQSPGLQSWSLLEELDGYPIEACRTRASQADTGRLEIAAELRSHRDRDQSLQIQTAFFDREGFPTGDETNWEPVVLRSNATVLHRATSLRPAAHFVVRVRLVD